VLDSRGLQVRSQSLSERGSWAVDLGQGTQLVFGRRRVTEKLQRFLAVYDRRLNQYLAQAERVDLRYQNGLAVRWREVPASAGG
jgi:cell division protein FtsQ